MTISNEEKLRTKSLAMAWLKDWCQPIPMNPVVKLDEEFEEPTEPQFQSFLELEGSDEVSVLLNSFNEYCRNHNKMPPNENLFHETMRQFGFDRYKYKHKKEPVYCGVRLK